MGSLKIAEGLTLPETALTERMSILGMSGAGKTNTATVIVEEMLKRGHVVCVLDPKGDFWGLQSSADGKSEGYPILVMGGEHRDVPLEYTAGVVVADLIVERDVSVVLDLSDMSKGKAKRFVTDFLEQLYTRRRRPMHLVVDEADLFCPQKPSGGDDARMLGALQDIVARGRKRGIGSTLVTQRAARLNKDALTQAEVLIAHRMAGLPDRKQIADWTDEHGAGADKAIMGEIARLKTGKGCEAFVWSPGLLGLQDAKRIRPRARETFDSSATPEVGKQTREPRRLAKMDLQKLTDAVKATVEKAKANEPSAQRARIAALEAELARAKQAKPAPAVPPKEVRVPVLDPGSLRNLKEAIAELDNTRDRMAQAQQAIVSELDNLREELAMFRRGQVRPIHDPQVPSAQPTLPNRAQIHSSRTERIEEGADRRLSEGALAALSVVASFQGEVVTRPRLAFLTGYSVRKSTFRNILSALRVGEYIADQGEGVVALPRGMELAGSVEPWPTDPEQAIERWRKVLPEGARKAFDYLVRNRTRLITRDELAGGIGADVSKSTFRNTLSVLRTNGLLEDSGDKVFIAKELLA